MIDSSLINLSNTEITRFLFALVLLLASAHFFGYMFQRFGIPRVIGEIVGGLILGPTFLGYLFPGVYLWIFNAFEAEGKLLSGIYWLGLVLLMFISGFEMQRSFSKDDRKIIIAILLGGTLIPFLAGWFVPNFYDISALVGPLEQLLALQIVISIAVAVTSIPVISKIFIDLGIMNTRFAKIVVATATIEDIILWVALAMATGIVSSDTLSLSLILNTVLTTLLFLLIGIVLLPKVFAFVTRLRINLLVKSSVLGYTLLTGFLLTTLASLLNVNIIFGALISGILIGSQLDMRFTNAKTSIKDFSLAFFIPIYFAIVGLKLDLIHHFDAVFFLAFLLFAMACKLLGTVLSAKVIKLDWLSSFNLGMAMNARGGPGIVLATVAFDMGIINESFFATLIMLAIVTSLLAGYWFRFVLNRKLELLST